MRVQTRASGPVASCSAGGEAVSSAQRVHRGMACGAVCKQVQRRRASGQATAGGMRTPPASPWRWRIPSANSCLQAGGHDRDASMDGTVETVQATPLTPAVALCQAFLTALHALPSHHRVRRHVTDAPSQLGAHQSRCRCWSPAPRSSAQTSPADRQRPAQPLRSQRPPGLSPTWGAPEQTGCARGQRGGGVCQSFGTGSAAAQPLPGPRCPTSHLRASRARAAQRRLPAPSCAASIAGSWHHRSSCLPPCCSGGERERLNAAEPSGDDREAMGD